MFSYELARLKDTSITANALHPGVVSTSFGADDHPGSRNCSYRPAAFHEVPSPGAVTSITKVRT
jgi:NAD(P)-dependent dehydrogenase (short-subunit alcohol dehydrogenase family)